MNIAHLGLLYLAVGGGLAVALRERGGPMDWGLLLVAWPLFGPFILFEGDESELSHNPLLVLLPDVETAQRMERRLAAAQARVTEIDGLLATPAFDAQAAQVRITNLEHDGRDGAARAVQARLRTIERLQALGARGHAELDEVVELMRQLETQVQVVRIAGGPSENTRALVDDLILRVDSLDAVLADDLLV